MIDSKRLSEQFSALSHSLRVDIFKCLLAHCPNGLSFGQLSTETQIAPSTLTHHLAAMEKGELIQRVQNGRSTTVILLLGNLRAIADDLMGVCCSVSETRPPNNTGKD